MTTMTMNRPEIGRETASQEGWAIPREENLGGTEFNFDRSMLLDGREPGLQFGEYIASSSNCCTKIPGATCCGFRAMSDERAIVEAVTMCLDRD